MGNENERNSGINDHKERHNLTCAICCVTSDDPAKLCAPTGFSGGSFCKCVSENQE
jgi:hypothetical protein